jgi:hypothetical protein
MDVTALNYGSLGGFFSFLLIYILHDLISELRISLKLRSSLRNNLVRYLIFHETITSFCRWTVEKTVILSWSESGYWYSCLVPIGRNNRLSWWNSQSQLIDLIQIHVLTQYYCTVIWIQNCKVANWKHWLIHHSSSLQDLDLNLFKLSPCKPRNFLNFLGINISTTPFSIVDVEFKHVLLSSSLWLESLLKWLS